VSSDISVSVQDGVQVIRLTRPDKKNSLTGEMYDVMREALVKGETDAAIAAHVFLGSGGSFCAGSDINDFMRRAALTTPIDGKISAPSTDFIRKLPVTTKPMIAAVDGLAIGIGVTLLLHCDLVYASPAAKFSTPFLNLALVQEAGSSVTGPARLGYQRAFELFILGETWDAARAEAAGLVNAVVPAADLEAKAIGAARTLAQKPRAAIMAARALMRGDPADISRMIEDEIVVFTRQMRSAEAKEAFQAFLEKRPPDFAKVRKG
jgi:enoyl-CoA hydratase/carnithine racemase